MAEGGARFDPHDGSADCARRARAALSGTRFGDVRWVAATGSTNADALALARDGAPEGIVVVADHQSAGRGRRDRTWVAPPGGSLLLSVLLRPPARVAGAVTMAAGVAMAEAVEQVAGVVAGLKWPNDLVVATPDGERKLAGILAEADWPAGSSISGGYRAPAPTERATVVVGVGLNVAWGRPPGPEDDAGDRDGGDDAGDADAGDVEAGDRDHADAGDADAGDADAGDVGAVDPGSAGRTDDLTDVAGIATALSWLGAPVDRVEVLVAFLRALDARYRRLVADGADELVAEWRRRSATLGRRVRIDLGADDIEGTAVDVTAEGHLVVDAFDGGRRTLAVGDVVHLRRA